MFFTEIINPANTDFFHMSRCPGHTFSENVQIVTRPFFKIFANSAGHFPKSSRAFPHFFEKDPLLSGFFLKFLKHVTGHFPEEPSPAHGTPTRDGSFSGEFFTRISPDSVKHFLKSLTPRPDFFENFAIWAGHFRKKNDPAI